jgi:hypothetical protein
MEHSIFNCHILYFQEILERTKYPLEVTTGQRKYGGPPPDYDGPEPGAGQEVRMSEFFSFHIKFVEPHTI